MRCAVCTQCVRAQRAKNRVGHFIDGERADNKHAPHRVVLRWDDSVLKKQCVCARWTQERDMAHNIFLNINQTAVDFFLPPFFNSPMVDHYRPRFFFQYASSRHQERTTRTAPSAGQGTIASRPVVEKFEQSPLKNCSGVCLRWNRPTQMTGNTSSYCRVVLNDRC